MQKRYIAATIISVTLSGAALADHNSRWGEGWAKMPNDIHNTRVETRRDNTTFRDFVRQGAGADSINRFESNRGRSRSQPSLSRSTDNPQVGSRRAGGRRR